MLLTKRWVELRDSVMKRNIPGSTPENWMTTTRENGEPLVVQRSVLLADGRQVYEMRGLWEMRKGALGGPFVSLAYPDSAQGAFVGDGRVYLFARYEQTRPGAPHGSRLAYVSSGETLKKTVPSLWDGAVFLIFVLTKIGCGSA